MIIKKQFMLALPFSIRRVSDMSYTNIGNCKSSLLVVAEGHGKLIELDCVDKFVFVPLDYDGDVDCKLYDNGCMCTGNRKDDNNSIQVIRGPHTIVYEHKSLLGRSLSILFRASGCRRGDVINRASTIKSGQDLVSSYVLYRRAGEYYLIFDTATSFIHVRLGEKPLKAKHRNGVFMALFKDYIRLLSPITGFIDIPSSESSLEPLGYNSEGDILLYNRNDGVVYAIDKIGGIKPVIRCNSISVMPSYEGYSIIECDHRVIGGVSAVASYGLALLKQLISSRRSLIIFPYIVLVDNDVSIIELGKITTVLVDVVWDGVAKKIRVFGLDGGIDHDTVGRVVPVMENEVIGKFIDCSIVLERCMLQSIDKGEICIQYDGTCSDKILRVWGRLVGFDMNSFEPVLVVNEDRIEPSVLEFNDGSFYAEYVVPKHLDDLDNIDRLYVVEKTSGISVRIKKIDIRKVYVNTDIVDIVLRDIDTIRIRLRITSNFELYKLFVLPGHQQAKIVYRELKMNSDSKGIIYEAEAIINVEIDELYANRYRLNILLVSDNNIRILSSVDVKGKIINMFGIINSLDILVSDDIELLEVVLRKEGHIVFRVNDIDMPIEVGGEFYLRVPGGMGSIVLRDRSGIRSFTTFGVKGNTTLVQLVNKHIIEFKCDVGCTLLCGKHVLASGRNVYLDLNDMVDLGDVCKIISIGYGTLKEGTVNVPRLLLRMAARVGIELAKHLKL